MHSHKPVLITGKCESALPFSYVQPSQLAVSSFFQLDDLNVYMWQHDQVQQAAYELIPKNKQDSFHLLIGTRLYMDTPDEEMKDLIFFVVDNMNHGVQLIKDQGKRTEVAQLNLRAGEKALSTSAFQSASEYLLAGISFLDAGRHDVTMRYVAALSTHILLFTQIHGLRNTT